jgi:hypothetical protein
MGFLDNSGDIILDAVLTDAGRARLARGDGSFKIAKYAFADDEIDYSKYDLNHASGSAYYDINVLTTPVIEALTNNTSTMKNRLLSIPKTNLFYLPILQINQKGSTNGGRELSTEQATRNSFIVSSDSVTDDILSGFNSAITQGYFSANGIFLSNTGQNSGLDTGLMVIDQGLNTTAISKSLTLDPTLRETQYIVEIDNRLGYITNGDGEQQAYSFLDDDNIASYSFGTDSDLVTDLGQKNSDISGPRGTRIGFRVSPSIELNSSTYLFTLLGTQETISLNSVGNAYRRIDSNIRITGATTGYRLNIPVIFLKDVV